MIFPTVQKNYTVHSTNTQWGIVVGNAGNYRRYLLKCVYVLNNRIISQLSAADNIICYIMVQIIH